MSDTLHPVGTVLYFCLPINCEAVRDRVTEPQRIYNNLYLTPEAAHAASAERKGETGLDPDQCSPEIAVAMVVTGGFVRSEDQSAHIVVPDWSRTFGE